jgi:hypothetical protein
MEWLLEMALMALLAATIFHAFRLERALGVLKRDRASLEALVADFNASTRAAEQGVERLHSAADGAGRQIERQIQGAARLRDDLQFLIDRGEQVADRLEAALRGGRDRTLDRATDLVVPDAPEVPPARLQSQAERDLLKALRLARA